MNIKLPFTKQLKTEQKTITGSKSESNRLLVLQALYPAITIENVSNSDDSTVLNAALASTDSEIDIHHAGTAMRFLTAYFASQPGREVVLTGSTRMQERPIKILVEALRQLGAVITYQDKEGFPPLVIKGCVLKGDEVSIPATVSSQYISALMLIAPSLPQGLTIHLEGEITSAPYLQMTFQLLNEIGVSGLFENNKIIIKPLKNVEKRTLTVESDWSSASYFYSLIALSNVNTKISLRYYKRKSLQGDAALATIYASLGVETIFDDATHAITLQKVSDVENNVLKFNLIKTPDIAQTIAVSCFGLGVACELTGLHTLKIKETDRLVALKVELEKLGAVVKISEESLTLERRTTLNARVAIDTYQDHRMAMAFAPLALRVGLQINDAGVVSKSYPDFWEDLQSCGINVTKQ